MFLQGEEIASNQSGGRILEKHNILERVLLEGHTKEEDVLDPPRPLSRSSLPRAHWCACNLYN